MAHRIILRLRHLLPLPRSFSLTSHIPSMSLAPVPSQHHHQPAKPHATSYLDGLRGLAVLIVCICHYTEVNHAELTPWYGVSPNAAPPLEPSWIQLPFLRVLFSGRPMVHVFFVISGFALSLQALAAVRTRRHPILASPALRRLVRLCGPPVVSMTLILLLGRAGWLWGALPAALGQHRPRGWVTWPWGWDGPLYLPDDIALWTISIELFYSMVLFLMVLALSRTRPAARVAFAIALVMYCLRYGKWVAAEFVGGMLLAELHLSSVEERGHGRLPLVNSSSCLCSPWEKELETSQRNKRSLLTSTMKAILYTAILAAALFIAGWPNVDASRTPGIRHLVNLVPRAYNPPDPPGPQNFWFAIAAIGAVWSCGRLTFVRKMILESRFAQYVGRISFSVYIVHGLVFRLLQDTVLGVSARPGKWVSSKGSGLRGWIGTDTAFNRTLCWAAGIAVLLPIVLVVANFVCQFVGVPLIRLAQKFGIWGVSDPDEVLEREMISREYIGDIRWVQQGLMVS
ncbi:acyltransferase family-domain-containing protein [Xylaria cf. heliscus]|nr:acyltransferase family-domain-containing protein [Xylaria cf. heliscus]